MSNLPKPGPSRVYVATTEHRATDPLLNACAHHGLTEEQTIEALFVDRREMVAQMARLTSTKAGPVFVLTDDESQRARTLCVEQDP